MAILQPTDHSALALGTGIKMPKQTFRFIVGGEPWMSDIIKQIVCVDMGAEDLSGPNVTHRTQRVILWLEDDVTCTVMRSIREWQKNPTEFTFDVTLVDSNQEWLEKYTFIGCTLDALQHSMLSYKGADSDRVGLTLKPAWPVMADQSDEGSYSISGVIQRSNGAVMKLLQVGFLVMKHEIRDEL